MTSPTRPDDAERHAAEAQRFARLDAMWREHGASDEWVFCSHMMRNGDFFIALSLLHEFRHAHAAGRRMRLLVTDARQEALARLFLDRIDVVRRAGAVTSLPIGETLRWMETRGLDRFAPGGLIMLQPWSAARPPFHLNAFIGDGHAFYASMMAMTLRLMPNTALCPAPVGEAERARADALAAEVGVVAGRTLVLFPYAQSFQGQWTEMLGLLASRAREEGFVVLTSCVPGKEEPVPGTAAVDIPFPLLRPFCEAAGFAVSARSGISDMLARSACRHVVIYNRPDLLRTWSLRALGWGGDAAELALEPGRQSPADEAARVWTALTEDAEAAQPSALPADIESFLALTPLSVPAGQQEVRVPLGLAAPHARFRGMVAHPGIVLAEGWWIDHRAHWTYGGRAAFHLRAAPEIAEAARAGKARLVLRGEAAVSSTMPDLALEVRLGRVAHARTLRWGEAAEIELPLPRGVRLEEVLACEIMVHEPRSPQMLQGRGEDRRPLGFGLSELILQLD